MLKIYRFYFISILFVVISTLSISAQEFNGDWICSYATTDDGNNGTGIQTISVTAIDVNKFVALVSQARLPWEDTDACYLVGYANADSTNGRLGTTPYGSSSDYKQVWISGFDQVYMDHARDLASRGNLIFVPNNDDAANILVFEITEDSVVTNPMRMATNKNPFETRNIWAIDIDDAGRVYVTTEGDSLSPSEVLIYESPDVESAWSGTHDADPLYTITLPDNGDARGVTVNPDGNVIYVSNFVTEKVHCYIGDTDNGYELYDGFQFTLEDTLTGSGGESLDPAPWGLQYMPGKNILWVACANDYQTGPGYEYGRYYLLNPNTGAILDTLDAAGWNYLVTGAYNSRSGGTVGNVSGYTSPYYVDFDPSFGVYTQSYFGWTVDKWEFSGEIPTIELTITGIEKLNDQLPSDFNLVQNYPNPFNPSTTIEFSLNNAASSVTLSVYTITGELVTDLIKSQSFNVGSYKISFDASGLSSGMYIYKLDDGTRSLSRKMMLIK